MYCRSEDMAAYCIFNHLPGGVSVAFSVPQNEACIDIRSRDERCTTH